MDIQPTPIAGVHLLTPELHADPRGSLFEAYVRDRLAARGLPLPCAQINLSHSRRGVLRGLHYQVGCPQAKLVLVTRGEIVDVAADLRQSSPTFGQWVSQNLSAHSRRQLYIPEGCAHGFYAAEDADVLYLLSAPRDPAAERGIAWDDPTLQITWPVTRPILSERDAALPHLAELGPQDLFE